jgi:hypothetical protein
MYTSVGVEELGGCVVMVDSIGCTAKMMLWCSLLCGGLCCSGGIIIIGVHVGLCCSVLWQINVGVDLLRLHSLIYWWRVKASAVQQTLFSLPPISISYPRESDELTYKTTFYRHLQL